MRFGREVVESLADSAQMSSWSVFRCARDVKFPRALIGLVVIGDGMNDAGFPLSTNSSGNTRRVFVCVDTGSSTELTPIDDNEDYAVGELCTRYFTPDRLCCDLDPCMN